MRKQLHKTILPFLSFFLALSFIANGQQKSINGAVTSSDGEGLPGVNIVVTGTSQGTITDFNGQYTLQVPADAETLTYSYVGFLSQTITIGNQSTISISLEADFKTLAEVVVVGYGTQEKANVTGAVGGIKADLIENRPFTSPDQALAGTIAGVNITNRSGDPGAPINVRIRGVGTVGNNQPLWVIDGVPIVQTTNITVNTSSTTDSNPLAGINPEDIASIDVLKDASAAAIYGARAANGVIIVTTKRGTAGKPKVTYSGYAGQAKVRDRINVLNAQEYIDIQGQLGRDLTQFSGNPDVDWQDLVFRSGNRSSHNISVTGGSENANYLISGGYLTAEGIEPGQDFERFSVKANSDIKVGDRFKFGESILISDTDRLTQSEGGGLFAGFQSSLNAPYFQPFDVNGPFGFNQETVANLGEGFASNRLLRTDERVNKTTISTFKILGNLYGEFEIIEGLKFRMSGGIDRNFGSAEFFQEEVDYGQEFQPSRIVQSRPEEQTTNWANTLTYERSFGDHNLSILLGYEETNFKFDKIRVQGNELFNTDIKFASTGALVSASNEADQWSLQGILGRINYNYNGKYLATFNMRRDATSRFASNNRDDIFPSISLGWRLSEEAFFPTNTLFDDVKIRGSWGQSGNQFTGVNFAFLSAVSTNIFYVLGEGQTPVRGPVPVNFANAALKWETSNQFDIGADIGLFEGKLQVTFDYYQKTSKDVLIGLPLPFVSGYFLPADANVGEIRNNGIELAAAYQNSIGDWTYSISGNVTTVNNEVRNLGQVSQIISGIGGGQTHQTIAGQSLGHFFGFKTDGLYQNQGEADGALTDTFSSGAEAGDIRFVDVDGDGDVDSEDRTNLGSPLPGFYYGGTFSVGYKAFDLSVQLRGVGDIQVYNQARSQLESLSGNANFKSTVLKRWTGDGTSNSIPRLTEDDPNGNNRFSDRWIEDAGFMRINNLQIGYTIPSSILENQLDGFVSRARFYFGVQNLATFTGYSGFDPEVTRSQSFQKGEFPLSTGTDDGASPQPRIWQFGWSVTF